MRISKINTVIQYAKLINKPRFIQKIKTEVAKRKEFEAIQEHNERITKLGEERVRYLQDLVTRQHYLWDISVKEAIKNRK